MFRSRRSQPRRSSLQVGRPKRLFRPCLEALEERWTPAILLVTNTNDSGAGSLRQAILDSNASVGVMDTIAFTIPGTGVQTIIPASALPAITDPVFIDGTTQPGYAGQPLIELDGENAGSGVDGLDINAGNTTVKGLVINRFSGNGIVLQTNDGDTIQSNYLGTNASGTGAQGNGMNGILIESNNHTIGGTSAGAGNVISGNINYGIFVNGGSNVSVQGNLVGTNATDSGPLGNLSDGIVIQGASAMPAQSNTVGGTTPGSANVISGNNTAEMASYAAGVLIFGAASNNLVEGNFIGTLGDGHTPAGNNGKGVLSAGGASQNTIGGTVTAAGNIIAFNVEIGGGVEVDNNSSGDGILSNSIFSNGFPGLTPVQTTPHGIILIGNANNNQTFPTLLSATRVKGGGTTIKGSLHSAANTTFRIEFFADDTPDPSGFGQGQIFLGFTSVTTDGNGSVSFTALVAGSVANGQVISATATDPNNNTSEFSQDICVPPVIPRDLAGRVNEDGGWWVAKSTGSSFSNQSAGSWSTNVTWVDVLKGDFDCDGHDDIAGRVANTGQWWIADFNVSGSTNQLWGAWSTAFTWVDVQVADVNGDGKPDIVGRALESGEWWVALSTGSSFINQLWTVWSTAVTWKDVRVGDFNGDGLADIAGRTAETGQWWVGLSTGASFNNSLWATWSTGATWVNVKVGDFNGDGKADITGRWLEGGSWWTGISTGNSFATSQWALWATGATWVDVQVGDFNGDGKADIAGRWLEAGQWWVAVSNGASFTNQLWATWSVAVTWVDVQVGDFNNDGLVDIVGRAKEIGQWWVAVSNGSKFTNQFWTAWSTTVTWVNVTALWF